MRRSNYSGLEWQDGQVLRGIPIARRALPLTLFPIYQSAVVIGHPILKADAAMIGKHLILVVTSKSQDAVALTELGEDLIAFYDDLVAQVYRLEFA